MARQQKNRLMGGFLKPVTILLFLVAFFVFYNAYLVDKSLEILNVSLEETANAQSATSVEAVSILLKSRSPPSAMTSCGRPRSLKKVGPWTRPRKPMWISSI